MKILFNDIIQFSDAPSSLKTPALSDNMIIGENITIRFDKKRIINSVGFANSNAKSFYVAFYNADFPFPYVAYIYYDGSGLYVLPNYIEASAMTIWTAGDVYIGRVGCGIGIDIPTAVAKEPSYNSTAETRVTLSGQVIEGLGGYYYRSISLDSRYKIDKLAMNEIKEGYSFIGRGYPFFLDLHSENYKLPFRRLYANEKTQQAFGFEGGIKNFLYSKRFYFEERF